MSFISSRFYEERFIEDSYLGLDSLQFASYVGNHQTHFFGETSIKLEKKNNHRGTHWIINHRAPIEEKTCKVGIRKAKLCLESYKTRKLP